MHNHSPQYRSSGPLRRQELGQSLRAKGIIDDLRERSIVKAVAAEHEVIPGEIVVLLRGVIRRYAIRVVKGKDLRPAREYTERLADHLLDYLPCLEAMNETGLGKPVYEQGAEAVGATGNECECLILTNSF